MNNISTLYQRAHALRMVYKKAGGEVALAEFFVGVALCECIGNMKNTRGETLRPMEALVYIAWAADVVRFFARRPEALRKTLLGCWPEDMARIWTRLLRTYGRKPRLLLAIADGMEA